MPRVSVRAASARYDVIVENGCLERAVECLAPLIGGRRLFVVADRGAYEAQGARLLAGLAGFPAEILMIELGEGRKRLAAVEELAERMHRLGADRSAVVAAFGGGIAGDVAGFLAACYMRGVDFVQIPTTLLAQVDAAVGGKTGVNLASGKNLVGAFHQPRLVLMDPSTFATLPEREYRAGLFEVVKHGVIRDEALFRRMSERRDDVLARDPELLESLVADSVRVKADVVQRDEREGGLRRILNYGHTLGHALEAETGYARLLHGEAVGWGMIAAGRLGEALGTISPADRERVEALIQAYGPLPELDGVDPERLAERTLGDKKTVGGRVHFVLLEAVGRTTIVVDPPREAVVAAAAAALGAVAVGAPR